jgi:hypothetical protein
MSNFENFTTVPATELQVGDRTSSKSRLTNIEVHEDGTVDAKWNNSPRVQHYPAGKVVGIWTPKA